MTGWFEFARGFVVLLASFAGAALMLLAAVGVVRLPDLFTRMQAATKASTLGAGLLLVAVAVRFGDLGTTARALAVILFLMFTAPVAAHMIGRAAYLTGVRLWSGTRIDELRGRYDERTRRLASPGEKTDADDERGEDA